MTRERQAVAKPQPVRAPTNQLIFNSLDTPTAMMPELQIASAMKFARSSTNPQSKSQAMSAEYRPASQPGAD
jgi:hypothetical protein